MMIEKDLTIEELKNKLVEKEQMEDFQEKQIEALNRMIQMKENHIKNLEQMLVSYQDYIVARRKREARKNKIMKMCGVWYVLKGIKKLGQVLSNFARAHGGPLRLLATWSRCICHPRRAVELYINRKKLCFWKGDRMLDTAYLLYGPLEVPVFENPEVSVIIPVYNQLEYTIHCIYSIANNTQDITYEIIIADDVSTDGTKDLSMYTKSIHVVRNQVNTGFLKNCNNAAETAKGKYILFLNNDTQVRERWMESLVALMERDSSVGMAGSKLLYPDGTLQEAGGIIWKDGGGWNYGRNQDPSLSEYNYVKEVDYISGASILIRKSLWDEIGGFDERFAPAYCEDSDFAFQVREHGYKVVYQPLSEVVHFEGVSNGTDISSGLKKYQVINTHKFREKWKTVFAKEQAAGPELLFLARDRSLNKKTILFIDHYVPHFDQDAGSKTVFGYVKAFVKMGYNVKFIGDNFYQHEPYTTALQQLGVEVLYGNWYGLHWKEWLKENGQYIDLVFTNRPHISIKYMGVLRKYTTARILYYGHDLHYLRQEREYELTHDEALLEEIEQTKAIEYSVMSQADVVYYPSEIEAEIIRKENPDIRVKAIPAYIYDEELETQSMDMSEKRDLLFVGGFNHTPNVDAVLWFVKEVFPEILKKLPEIKLNIIGSKAPQEILDLNSESINVLGFVSDEELAENYRKCRIDVVPLRYGAGIKGKVIEAIHNHIPIVTTSVGAEGLEDCGEILRIEDDAKKFAEAVVELYGNIEASEKMIAAADPYIKKYFSTDAVLKVIGEDIR